MMETREIELRRGIERGGVVHRLAVLREQTVQDVLEANRPRLSDGQASAANSNEVSVAIIARRLIRLGNLDQKELGEIVVKQLAADDFGRLDQACEAMDAELAAWIGEAERARRKALAEAKGQAGGR